MDEENEEGGRGMEGEGERERERGWRRRSSSKIDFGWVGKKSGRRAVAVAAAAAAAACSILMLHTAALLLGCWSRNGKKKEEGRAHNHEGRGTRD